MIEILCELLAGEQIAICSVIFPRYDIKIWKSLPDFFNMTSQPCACATIIEAIFEAIVLLFSDLMKQQSNLSTTATMGKEGPL